MDNLTHHKTMSTLADQFKETDTKPQEAPKRKYLGLLKEGALKYKLTDGQHYIRLLPQPNSSPFNNFLKFNEFTLKGGQIEGAIALDPADADVDKLYWAVRNKLAKHPEFKYELQSKENEDGISFSTKPRVAFLGFDFAKFKVDKKGEVKVIVLPGTYPDKEGATPRKKGAGTIVAEYIHDVDINDNPRYGDVFSAKNGKLVRFDIANSGKRTMSYTPSVEPSPYPIVSGHDQVLAQIKQFDEVLDLHDASALKKVFKKYLPERYLELLEDELFENEFKQPDVILPTDDDLPPED